MWRIRYFLRLKIGRTAHWMRYIQSFTSMRSTILCGIMESFVSLQPMLYLALMRRGKGSPDDYDWWQWKCEILAVSPERTENRGVKDILIICADGLTGIKEAISAAFPKTEYQRCIVHQVRNTLKYVPDKDRKAFAADLKTIYQAADEQKALAALERVTENGLRNTRIPWNAGKTTGMLFLQF